MNSKSHGSNASGEVRPAPYFEEEDSVGLVRHARDAGRDNLPPTSAVEPNDVEKAIEREYRNRHRLSIESARGDIRAAAEAFATIEDRLSKPRDLQRVSTQATASIEHELAADQSVEATRREQQLRERDERRWRRENGVSREARYPASPLLHLGFVAVLVLIEAACNMSFFSAGSALGLLGGYLLAGGVSLTNVVAGVVAGYFGFRYLRVRDRRQRIAAQVGVAVYILAVVIFNAAIARLRDVVGAGPGSGHLEVSEVLRHAFELSPLSLGLFILGLVASGLAVADGYTLDDPHPGFGALARAKVRATEEAAAAEAALCSKVLGHAEAVPERCTELLTEERRQVEQLRKLVVNVDRLLERYETERASAEHWCHVLLQRYRSENLAVRTSKAPAYWEDFPTFAPELDTKALDHMRTRELAARERLEELATKAHTIHLEQPGRMAAARDQLHEFVRRAMERADAGPREGREVRQVEISSMPGRRAAR